MPNTVKKSGRKSTKSRDDLVYHRDFWQFYKLNKAALDKYIELKLFKFNTIPHNDLKQDVLLSLYEKDVLASYNPKKSKLVTYIVNNIYWAASHISEIARNHEKRRVFTCELNAVQESRPELITTEKESPDETTYINEVIRKARAKLNDHQKIVLDLIVQEYTQTEIAKEFDNTPQGISNQMRSIREKALQYMKEIKNVK